MNTEPEEKITYNLWNDLFMQQILLDTKNQFPLRNE